MNKYIILIGFFLRVIIAFWNGFFGPSFGAGEDAQGFQLSASEISKNLEFLDFNIGTNPYLNYLGFIYWCLTDSLFIGSLLSCIAWLISSILLLEILKLLSVKYKNIYSCMLIYAFLPSSFLYTSVTLREVYQLLFVNITIYAAVFIFTKKSYSHWLLLIIGCLGSSILHGALMAFNIGLFALTLFFYTIKDKKKLPWMKIVISIPLIVFVLFFGFTFFTQISYQLDDGLLNGIVAYQEGGLNADGRAFYKDSSSINGTLDLILFIPISLFQYLFEPMPWKMSAIVDIPMFFENILRAWLIWNAIKGLHTISSEKHIITLYVFIAYIFLELIWSIGTINWGTASRHHVPSMGMLLVCAFINRKTKNNT